jgi:protein gp37
VVGESTAIDYVDHTFNGAVGCVPYVDPVTKSVSRECEHCYMYTEQRRRRSDPARVWRTGDSYWRGPLTWHRKAAKAGTVADVLDYSYADVFGLATDAWRDDLWALIRQTPSLRWLLLTKRTRRMALCLPDDWGEGYPNVALGVTMGHSDYTHRLDDLCAVPARWRWVSCEPLLSGMDLRPWLPQLSLVVAGGETGPDARPMEQAWPRALCAQCQEAGTPFHFKRWGEWAPATQMSVEMLAAAKRAKVRTHACPGGPMYLVGKRAAVRVLDGRTWDGKVGSRR